MLTRCPNGHIYDANTVTFCPECPIKGLELLEGVTTTNVEVRPLARGRFADIWPDPSSRKIDPVVGWLVATDGPVAGRDFRIFSGMNTIGRHPHQVIAIDDSSIRGARHAVLVFDCAFDRFYLTAENGSVSVNGSAITEAVELIPFSTITFGGSTLLFVPLCGKYTWERVNDGNPRLVKREFEQGERS